MKNSLFARLLPRRLTAAAALYALVAPSLLLSFARPAAAQDVFPPLAKTVKRSSPTAVKEAAALVSTTLVISQFQVAGASAADEFVELHNVSNAPVDLNGHRLVYRAAAGTTDVSFADWTTSTIVPAGGFFLIAHATGYDDTVGANRTFNTGSTGTFSAASGGIALRSGAANTGTIVDSVGYGSATNAFVEGAAVPVPAANASRARGANGCTDTDNNNSDFGLVSPAAPRNASSTVVVCGGGGGQTNPTGAGAASPSSVAPGGATLLTVAVTPGTNPASTTLAVTANLSSIGGPAAQSFFDDGTNGDATAGDNTFSFAATVAAGTAPGAKNIGAQISDAQGRTGGATIALTVTAPPVTGQPLPFMQNWSNANLITTNDNWTGVAGIVGYRGDDLTTSTGTDPQTIVADGAATPVNVLANQTTPNVVSSGGLAEFELTDPAVALQGSGTADAPHLVVRLDTTGKSNITVSYNLRDLDGSADDAVQPVALQYRVGGSGAYTNLPAGFVADATSGPDESSQVTPVNVALPPAVDNQTLVELRIITANAVGNDEWVGVDDLAIVADGSIPLTASGAASPNTVEQGAATLLTVRVNPATNPASTALAVTADLSPIGGAAAQSFFDDGTNGDVTAGDNTFSFAATVPAATATGAKSLAATAVDAQGRTAGAVIGLTVIVPGGGSPHTPAEHLTLGNPSNATADVNEPFNYLLPKNQYVLSYHRDRAIPNWVSWHLDSTWLGPVSRQNDFRPDPDLPAGWYQATNTSYSGSGFDRGHHTPSGDRTNTIPDNSATFLMTNMMPQAPGNNQGPWERLESFSRALVGQGNELYIVAGGYGTGGTGDNGFATTVDAGRVTVPAYTWKVIVVLPVGDNDASRVTAATRAIAVIMPNNTAIRNDEWQKYLATVDQVEALTGYDFFSNVPQSIQRQFEARLDPASNTAPRTLAGGTYADLDLAATPQVTLTGNITVTGTLTLGASILNTGNFKVTLAPGATVSRLSGYVNGAVEKQYDAAGASFVYPVGTSSGYSPVTVAVTALGTTPSSLAVRAVDGVHPNAPFPVASLGRYWTLDETGDLTADITFQYLERDVPAGAPENTLRLNRFAGSFTQIPATIDTTANTATATGVSQFSVDWTLLAALVPTAASVEVAGRVATVSGAGVSGALVTLTNGDGEALTARTNQFGYYRFESVRAGEVYLVAAAHKRYRFAPAVVEVREDLTGLNLTALEE